MKLFLLKLVEFETRNHSDIKLTVRSNSDSDYFRDSNLTTTELERFFSEREGSGTHCTIADGSTFVFKYLDFFKYLSTYHFWKIHDVNRLKIVRQIIANN